MEPPTAITPILRVIDREGPATQTRLDDAAMPCERCGSEMYRMHAVWRCPACGFKTDCCGW